MVRTAVDKEHVRATRISLLSALAAGVLVFLGWLALRDTSSHPAVQRRLVDVQVDWVCDRNPAHVMRATGGYDPVPCARCDGSCYIRLVYQCPVHGQPFDALVKITVDAEGDSSGRTLPNERVVGYRYLKGSGDWHSAAGYVVCPVPGCGVPARRPRPTWIPRGTVTSQP